MQYKIPSRVDVGHLQVEFEQSYEPTGPFGAKSIGEIVINTPSPAIAHAIYRATGVWHRDLPITPEAVFMEKSISKIILFWENRECEAGFRFCMKTKILDVDTFFH